MVTFVVAYCMFVCGCLLLMLFVLLVWMFCFGVVVDLRCCLNVLIVCFCYVLLVFSVICFVDCLSLLRLLLLLWCLDTALCFSGCIFFNSIVVGWCLLCITAVLAMCLLVLIIARFCLVLCLPKACFKIDFLGSCTVDVCFGVVVEVSVCVLHVVWFICVFLAFVVIVC